MAYDPNNVFAKILRGELPCVKLAENAHTLAFMDLMPQAMGHALIVCREPAETILDVSPEGAAECIRMTQRIAKAVSIGLQVPSLRIMQFTGRSAGQTVPHLHFHVIPIRPGESLRHHAAEMTPAADLEPIAVRIRAALAQADRT